MTSTSPPYRNGSGIGVPTQYPSLLLNHVGVRSTVSLSSRAPQPRLLPASNMKSVVSTVPVPLSLRSLSFPTFHTPSFESWGWASQSSPPSEDNHDNMWIPSNEPKGLPADSRGKWVKASMANQKVSINSIAVDWVGRRALTGSADGSLRLWDLDTMESRGQGSGHKRTWTLPGHTSGIWIVVADWTGKQAVTGSEDRCLKLWDLNTGDLKNRFEGHTDTVFGVSADWVRKLILSASWDSTLKLWDLKTGECYQTLVGHTMGVCAVAVDWVWRRALSGSGDGSLRLWDLEKNETQKALTGHTGGVRAVTVDWFKKQALSASGDSTLKLWDLQSGKCEITFHGHSNGVCAVVADWVWKRAVSSSHDCSVKIWDIDAGTCLRSFGCHGDTVYTIAADLAARQTLSGSRDGTVRLLDLETGKILWNESL